MSFISYVPYDKAEADLEKLYKRFRDKEWGGVDHILRIHGLNPRSMSGHYDYYRHLMKGPSPLSRVQREMIAVVVSTLNRCHY